jgi:O-antigen ligase
MGVNRSKNEYKTAITQFCQNPPVIFVSNTHKGWLDAVLASGIPGKLLLLLVMLNYTTQGLRMIKAGGGINAFVIAMFISAAVLIFVASLTLHLETICLKCKPSLFSLILALGI